MKRSAISFMLAVACCLMTLDLSTAKDRQEDRAADGNMTSNSDGNFPDYTQPTTRFVTSGANLRRTRLFGLSEQMGRETMGIQSR